MGLFLYLDPPDAFESLNTDWYEFYKPLLLLSKICCNFGGIIVLSYRLGTKRTKERKHTHSAVVYKVHNNKAMSF